ncbi:hypothetical protein J0895_00085 [Phormidium pseudopriestleyi FRX01]|uniref:Uncharacterized protein n=1 Tax=Phormidium pseudopriestleyi FRX01 TaxID=1759528 RepID=A0ABS3FKC2_9CYAN|nr:hypothetical protein [Phormidium pseudopriestleyi]MBO0347535.1 hypothetical protein [Phormidium pseudopriestleyi FRX01]
MDSRRLERQQLENQTTQVRAPAKLVGLCASEVRSLRWKILPRNFPPERSALQS